MEETPQTFNEHVDLRETIRAFDRSIQSLNDLLATQGLNLESFAEAVELEAGRPVEEIPMVLERVRALQEIRELLVSQASSHSTGLAPQPSPSPSPNRLRRLSRV